MKLLQNYKKITIQLLVFWTLFITIARALRMPNDFSEAHWLLDYRFGFMKRGLIGTISNFFSSIFDYSITPELIAIYSGIIFSIFVISIFLISRNLLEKFDYNLDIVLFLSIFSSSSFMVMSGHLFGYFDALIYVFTFVSIGLVFKQKLGTAAIIQTIAVLTHESYILIGLPLVLLALVVEYERKDFTAITRKAIILFSAPMATFALLIIYQSLFLDSEILRQQLVGYLGSFDFVSTRVNHVADYQTRSFLNFLSVQFQYLDDRLLDKNLLVSVGPALLALLYFIHSALRITPFSKFSFLLIGVITVPLAMHAIAWDASRIWTYTLAGAFLSLWILSKRRETDAIGNSFALIAIPAILINIYTSIPLMDSEIERYSHLYRTVYYLPVILLFINVLIGKFRKFSF